MRWTTEKANQWHADQPWLVGCNFTPSTAINQLEMWQEGTFDRETIDRELGWASEIGFNTVRTYLHDLAWEVDAEGFKERIDQFLAIAHKHGIRPMLVIFDDCWNPAPHTGEQPAPKPGVHNSGWWQSPGVDVVNDPASWDRLERYAKDIIHRFAEDERVLMWDLYNEPGNSKIKSLALVESTFQWARDVNPAQPLTVGVWNYSPEFQIFNEFQISHSDIVTFHHYGPPEELKDLISRLQGYNRPLICTEWMARALGSHVQTNLPIFQQNNVGCINWGLVSGKTNTIFSWQDIRPGGVEPDVWFHDLFRPDGSPYDETEISIFREQITASQ